MNLQLRRATATDAVAVSDVYLRSRKELVACAPLVHSDESVRDWVRRHLIPLETTTVAVVEGQVVGLMAVAKAAECSWIEQLYLHPAWVRRAIGTRLLELARRELPPPIRLYTFQCNVEARSFYEHHGFTAIAFGDGSGNEEKCPDILYEWRPEQASPARRRHDKLATEHARGHESLRRPLRPPGRGSADGGAP